MERSRSFIETVKTLLIAVLTLSAVLLTAFYWADLSLDSLFTKKPTDDTPIQTPDAPKTREIIAPAEICVNRTGEPGGEFTVLFPEDRNAWQTAVTAFASFSRSEGASLEETTEANYTALSAARSVRISFAYGLPFDGFCKQFGIASAPFTAVNALNEIVYSEAAPDSLFVEDRASGKHYRLIGSEEELGPLRELAGGDAGEGETLSRTVSAVFGESNPALLPTAYAGVLRNAAVEKEFHEAKRDTEADRFARTFFDNSLDFVRRVEDSKGLLTYIYNYTQKVLTVTADGIAEYKEEIAESTVTQGFYASLGTALSFVAEHGGWYPTLTVDGETSADGFVPYLLSASEIASGHRSGYRFAFGFRAGREILCAGDEAAITVDVYDGQVTYYRRAMFTTVALKGVSDPEAVACLPAEALANNRDWAYETLAGCGVVAGGASGEERARRVLRAVTRVKSGYLFNMADAGDVLDATAVWAVRAGKALLFFDLVTGEPVSYAVDAD